MIDKFWCNKKVVVTGGGGFKGRWLVEALAVLEAHVMVIDAFNANGMDSNLVRRWSSLSVSFREFDIRDLANLKASFAEFQPDIVFHLAAQPLVSVGHLEPLETFDVNVMGTLNVFQACCSVNRVRSVINVTSDKCYLNRDQDQFFNEVDCLGGDDPYGGSKACAEIVAFSVSEALFRPNNIRVGNCRAGNVIGGGDFGLHRLVPDLVRSIESGEILKVRNLDAIRPWQFVGDLIIGYLQFAKDLFTQAGPPVEAMNFSSQRINKNVQSVVNEFKKHFPSLDYCLESKLYFKEKNFLSIDPSLAEKRLGWVSLSTFEEAVNLTSEWYKCYLSDGNVDELTREQLIGCIERHMASE